MSVYFVAQEQPGPTLIKIGVAKDIKKRQSDLQTGNPYPLALMGWIESEDAYRVEKRLHRQFAKHRQAGEWFRLEAGDILSPLKQAGIDGFVAKNADAFQVVRYDRNAVPEYLGVWDWGNLELDDCCPHCGCMCGMHFQEASWMYHCINCDTLTNFEELSPQPPGDWP